MSLHTEAEPYKPWRRQYPLLEIQNEHALVFNNASLNIVGDRERNPYTPARNMISNYQGEELALKGPLHFDFNQGPGLHWWIQEH